MSQAPQAVAARPLDVSSVETSAPPIVMEGREVTPVARRHRIRLSAGPVELGWERWRPVRIVVEGPDEPRREAAISDWQARAVIGIWIVAALVVLTRRTRRSR